MTSPAWMPAMAARPSGLTSSTSRPLVSFGTRAPGRDRADDDALRLFQAEAFGQVRRDRLHHDTELRPGDLALGPQLIHHVLRHVRRNREADADVAVVAREDLRVDPDQLALRVDERAARVAVVDRRVGLEEVLVAAVADAGRPSLRADNAHRDRLADAQRVAHREHDVADL